MAKQSDTVREYPGNILDNALWAAYEAHQGQFRRFLKDPYIVHPVRVSAAARRHALGLDAEIAGLLHDVLEDSPKYEVNWRKVGGQRVQRYVVLLTKNFPKDDVHAKVRYYAAIRDDETASALKVLDRTDNLIDMSRVLDLSGTDEEIEWAQAYVMKTQREIVPLVPKAENYAIAQEFFTALGAVTGSIALAKFAGL